jgi:3-methylfumaryl-CoA hydratase
MSAIDANPDLDMEHLRGWIGRQEVDDDLLDLRHARLMAATVGTDPAALENAGVLPPLWHWIYFLSASPAAALGRDGHPARGGFLPPVPLANRMWAGGRVTFTAPLPLGAAARKTSTVLDVQHKRGRGGDLVFVTVEHALSVDGRECLREEHDIVYRNPSAPGQPSAASPEPAPKASQHQRPFDTNSTLLFRYSALTFNGHRIHYDADYCREHEGYAAPVVHGPLNATLLAGLAAEVAQRPLKTFSYRGQAPAVLGQALTLHADVDGETITLATRFADGRLCMSATAR